MWRPVLDIAVDRGRVPGASAARTYSTLLLFARGSSGKINYTLRTHSALRPGRYGRQKWTDRGESAVRGVAFCIEKQGRKVAKNPGQHLGIEKHARRLVKGGAELVTANFIIEQTVIRNHAQRPIQRRLLQDGVL